MSANTIARKHYRTPTASAYAEVSLDEFSREQIESHLAHLNGCDNVHGGEGEFSFSGDEMNQIETLIVCGQRDAAREYVCEQISRRIGRRL